MYITLLIFVLLFPSVITDNIDDYRVEWSDTTKGKGKVIDTAIGAGGRITVVLCEGGVFFYNEFWYYESQRSGKQIMGFSLHSIPETINATRISLSSEAGILAVAFADGRVSLFKIYFKEVFLIAIISPDFQNPTVSDLSISSVGSVLAVGRNRITSIYTFNSSFSQTDPPNANNNLSYTKFDVEPLPEGESILFVYLSPSRISILNTGGVVRGYYITKGGPESFFMSDKDPGTSCDYTNKYYSVDVDYTYFEGTTAQACENACLFDKRCTSYKITEDNQCTIWFNGNCNSDLSRGSVYDGRSVHRTRLERPIASISLTIKSSICRKWDQCSNDLFNSSKGNTLHKSRLSGFFLPTYGTLGAFYSSEGKLSGVWRLLPPYGNAKPWVLYQSTDIEGFTASESSKLVFEITNGTLPSQLNLAIKSLELSHPEVLGSANTTFQLNDINFSCGSDTSDETIQVTSSPKGSEVLISFRGCIKLIAADRAITPNEQFSSKCLNKPSLFASLSLCRDGSYCKGDNCCSTKSGILGCPPETPLLCKQSTCGDSGNEPCCSTTCEKLLGETKCYKKNHNIRFEEARTTEKICTPGFDLVTNETECLTAVQHLDPTASNTSINVVIAKSEEEGLTTDLPYCYYDENKSIYIYNSIGISDFISFQQLGKHIPSQITPICMLESYVVVGFKNTKCFDVFNYPNIRSEAICRDAHYQITIRDPIPQYKGVEWGGYIDASKRKEWPSGCFYSPELNKIMFNYIDESSYTIVNNFVSICSTRLDNYDWVLPQSGNSDSHIVTILIMILAFSIFLVFILLWFRWHKEHNSRMAALREIGPHIETVDVAAHVKKYSEYLETLIIPFIPPEEASTDCSVCLDALCDLDCVCLPDCSHIHHLECLMEYVIFRVEKERKKYPKCPLCRKEIRLPKKKESLWKRLQDDKRETTGNNENEMDARGEYEVAEDNNSAIDLLSDGEEPGNDLHYVELHDVAE